MTQAPPGPASPISPPPVRPVRRRSPSPGPAPLVILAAMLVMGLLIVTNTWKLSDAPLAAAPTSSGCQRLTPQADPGNELSRRLDAPLVALATVEADATTKVIDEARTPGFEWLTVRYRIIRSFRDSLGCPALVSVSDKVAVGAPLTLDNAPLLGTRVLLFARPDRSGDFSYLTYATTPLEAPPGAGVYRVTRDPNATEPQVPVDQADPEAPVLLVDVPLEPADEFLTPGPGQGSATAEVEVPVRLRLVATGIAFDPAATPPERIDISLADAVGNEWMASVPVDGRIPAVDASTAAPPIEAIVSPSGGNGPLGANSYSLTANLAYTGDIPPIDGGSAQGSVVTVECLFECP